MFVSCGPFVLTYSSITWCVTYVNMFIYSMCSYVYVFMRDVFIRVRVHTWCVHTCTYSYVYVYVFMRVCVHTFTCSWVYVFMHIRVHACTSSYQYVFMRVCVHMLTCSWAYVFMHVRVHEWTCSYQYVFISQLKCNIKHSSNYRWALLTKNILLLYLN